MTFDILCLAVFLILIFCRLILLCTIAAHPQQQSNPFVPMSSEVDVERWDREARAENYLRRVIAVTGAAQRQNDCCCVLNVGKSRFLVYQQYVERIQDVTDPNSRHELTCFYLPDQFMPSAERMATALLHLKNNPALYDGWFAKNAAFKANGKVFRLIEKPPFS